MVSQSKVIPRIGRIGIAKKFNIKMLREREWVRCMVVLFSGRIKYQIEEILLSLDNSELTKDLNDVEKLVFARDMLLWRFRIGVNMSEELQVVKQQLYLESLMKRIPK